MFPLFLFQNAFRHYRRRQRQRDVTKKRRRDLDGGDATMKEPETEPDNYPLRKAAAVGAAEATPKSKTFTSKLRNDDDGLDMCGSLFKKIDVSAF